MYTGIYAPVQLFSAPVPAGAATVVSVPGPFCRSADLQDGGDGKITGTTNKGLFPGTPVGRRVRLFSERDGRLIREMWSDSVSGEYAFYNVSRAVKYTVIAYDHTGFYNAKIISGATADPM